MFIAYGSIFNAIGIIFCHVLYFWFPTVYIDLSPYLSTIFGVQLIKAVSDIRLSYKFHFCDVTRFNNWCYLLICIVYMVFYWMKLPEIYTIIVQTILAVIGLVSFIWLFIKKYPNCRISLYIHAKKKAFIILGIFAKMFTNNRFDCDKTLDEFKKHRYNKHLSNEKL